ncbi:MAG: histidine kinase, partial [Bacteroidota bacterium]
METTQRPRYAIFLALVVLLCHACTDPNYDDYRPDLLPELSEKTLERYKDTSEVFPSLREVGKKDRLDSLLRITEQLKNFDELAALLYAQAAYDLSTAENWEVARGISAHLVGLLKSRQTTYGERVASAMVDARISQSLLRDEALDLWSIENDGLIGHLHYRSGNLDSATFFAGRALEHIESMENPSQFNKQKAFVYHDLANIFMEEDENEALRYFWLSDSLYEKIGNTKNRSFLWYSLSTLYLYKDLYDKADSVLLNCIGIGRATNNNTLLADVYRAKGLIEYFRFKESRDRQDFDHGIDHLRNSFTYGKRVSYGTYELIGYTYQLGRRILGENAFRDSALKYFDLATVEARKDGALVSLDGSNEEILNICFEDSALCSEMLMATGPEYVHEIYQTILDTVTSQSRTAYQRLNEIVQRDIREKAERKSNNQLYVSIGIIGFLILLFIVLYQQQQNKRLQARMIALRAQINPHFISNSLNAIESLINHDKKEQAGKYLIHFSRLSRQILNSSATSTVSLTAELKTLEHFLALEELRFKGKLDYDIAVQPGLNSDMVEVPAMILQPFIENSIWHGIKPKPEGGFIMVEAKREEDVLLITIEDDGIGREKAAANKKASPLKQKSMGMEITAERIKAAGKVKGSNVSFVDLKNDDGSAR